MCSAARAIACSSSSGVGSGAAAATIPIAVSTRTPVGAPPAPRRMRPPSGSGVPGPTPAAARAARLARPMWPSVRMAHIFTPRLLAGSSHSLVGSSPPHSSWFQPHPSSHPPSPTSSAAAAALVASSPRDLTPRRSRRRRERPPRRRCACASIRPGMTYALPRSSRRAPAASMCGGRGADPTYNSLPFLPTAMVSAQGSCVSPVQIRALENTAVAVLPSSPPGPALPWLAGFVPS
mmetsp:Transcript_46270/g.148124  ORF Transcript_46270/g.148124 Transcript_46270/m.148124 type:complete len:235 (-) Transcript_46270:241-945(-)